MAPEIKQEQPPPKGYAHYPLNPYANLPKNNPNAMDYMPIKKDPIQNNGYNHNNNAFVSPKNEFLIKESPLPQPHNYKNDFVDKRKYAVSPSPRYRENNIINDNNKFNEKIEKISEKLEKVPNKRLEQKPQIANFKPMNPDSNKEKLNLLPPISNRNKDNAVMKTPFKEPKKEEREKDKYNIQKLANMPQNNSYENIGKNEICITEPTKLAKKSSEQKFENLRKKYNIKEKEEEKKQEIQKEKNRELERKQMMSDIEKKVQ